VNINIKSEYKEQANSIIATTKVEVNKNCENYEEIRGLAEEIDAINRELFENALLFTMVKTTEKNNKV